MDAQAVIFEKPERLVVDTVKLTDPVDGDLVVESRFSGISTGTERLLWQGRMPEFPGMGYPLVPGYETVAEIVDTRGQSEFTVGQQVFVPGSSAYENVRGLFGGSASRIVVPANRVIAVDSVDPADATLLALAATAHHALTLSGTALPDLIVGYGVLGRLAARMVGALGGKPPKVWENNPDRRNGAEAFEVLDPDQDAGSQYGTILDVSGDASIIDRLASVLTKGGEIVLGGFYSDRINFAFPPAFMKEARFRIAAEWQPDDMTRVTELVRAGKLRLDGLVTHKSCAADAHKAYATAFDEPDCLKMILDWKESA